MEELKGKFLIQCLICKSTDVKIVPSGFGGEILVYCNEAACENEQEV